MDYSYVAPLGDKINFEPMPIVTLWEYVIGSLLMSLPIVFVCSGVISLLVWGGDKIYQELQVLDFEERSRKQIVREIDLLEDRLRQQMQTRS